MEEYKYKWQIFAGAGLLVCLIASLFMPRLSISGEDYIDMAVDVYEYAQEKNPAAADHAGAEKFLEDYRPGGELRDSVADSYNRMISARTGEHPRISGLYLGRCAFWEEELPAFLGWLIYLPVMMALGVLVFMLVKRKTYALWLLLTGVVTVMAELLLYLAVPVMVWSRVRMDVASLPLISDEIFGIQGTGQEAVTQICHNCFSMASWIVPVIGILLVAAGILFLTCFRPVKKKETEQNEVMQQVPQVKQVQPVPERGRLTGIQGQYAGESLTIEGGEEIVLGRDPAYSMLVFSDPDISRRHCGIRYDAGTGSYLITDYSSTGTRLGDGTLISASSYTAVPPGTVLYLGKGNEKILLG